MNLSAFVPRKTTLASGWGWIGKARARQYVTVVTPAGEPVHICYTVKQARAYIRAQKEAA